MLYCSINGRHNLLAIPLPRSVGDDSAYRNLLHEFRQDRHDKSNNLVCDCQPQVDGLLVIRPYPDRRSSALPRTPRYVLSGVPANKSVVSSETFSYVTDIHHITKHIKSACKRCEKRRIFRNFIAQLLRYFNDFSGFMAYAK